MIPVYIKTTHQLSSITENPFDIETLTENPVVMKLNVIGKGGSRAVIGGTHTQIISDGRKGIIHSNVITQVIMNHIQMSIKGDSFPFYKEQTQTLMLASFVEAFLEHNRNIGTTSILG